MGTRTLVFEEIAQVSGGVLLRALERSKGPMDAVAIGCSSTPDVVA